MLFSLVEMRIKNWIEWTPQMSKIWEKIQTRTYCKFLLLPFKCESQSGPEKPDDKRNIFTLWQEFLSQYWGKYRWIPLLWAGLCSSSSGIFSSFFFVACFMISLYTLYIDNFINIWVGELYLKEQGTQWPFQGNYWAPQYWICLKVAGSCSHF